MKRPAEDNQVFSQEQIDSFAGLYHALKRIHFRLEAEGYVIQNGKIVLPPNKKQSKMIK
jgi:hypothetical protein